MDHEIYFEKPVLPGIILAALMGLLQKEKTS